MNVRPMMTTWPVLLVEGDDLACSAVLPCRLLDLNDLAGRRDTADLFLDNAKLATPTPMKSG